MHIATPIVLSHDLYDTQTVADSLDLAAVGTSAELLERADLVLVLLKGKHGEVYYYPYKIALYLSPED